MAKRLPAQMPRVTSQPDSGAREPRRASSASASQLVTAMLRPLIAFSNEYIYNQRLITFPGPGLSSPVRHVLVEKQPGDSDEESSAAEVDAVAELVRSHAHRDVKDGIQKSLGAIAMGIKHMRRIEARIEALRQSDPVLDTFLNRPGESRFFVKNLERV